MSKYFLVMEDISITLGAMEVVGMKGITPGTGNMRVIMFKKGQIGEVVGTQTAKNGYFFAKHLDSDDVHEIPYAPAFIKFVGDDLETIRNLYEDEEETDFDLGEVEIN